MKKLFFAFAFSLVSISLLAQSTEKPQLLKYVSTGPDGAVVFTVIDDSRKSAMTLESVNDFYKYQLVDLKTGETVLTARNNGKIGSIDKSKLTSGDYNLRVYTKSFIITSEITVGPSNMNSEAIAMTAPDEN